MQVYGAVGGGVGGGVGCGLRLVWEGQPTQEMVLHDGKEVGGGGVGEKVVVGSVCVLDPYVLLVLSDGGIGLLRLDEEEEEFVCVGVGGWGGGGGGGKSPITAASLFVWGDGQGLGRRRRKEGGGGGRRGGGGGGGVFV